MEVIDVVLSVGLVVAFLVGTLYSRNSWFLIESIVCAILGAVTFIIPRQFLSYIVKFKDDDISSIYRLQMVGSQLVSAAFITYKLSKSPDKSIRQCLTVSRMFICFSLFCTAVKAWKDYPSLFKPPHLWFGVLGVVLWFIGNLVQFVRSGFFGTGHWIMNDRLCKHMLFDFFMCTTVLFPNMMWPEYMLKYSTGARFPVTNLGIYWCHVIGCFMLGVAIQLYHAIGFNDEDKVTYAFGRVISFTCYVASMFYWCGAPDIGVGTGLLLLLGNLLIVLIGPTPIKKD